MMLSHANVSRAMACFEHSNFFKVTAPEALVRNSSKLVVNCAGKSCECVFYAHPHDALEPSGRHLKESTASHLRNRP